MVSVVHACSKAAVKNRLNSVIKTISLLLFQDDAALKNGTGKAFFRAKIFCEDGLGKGGSHTQDEEVPLCEAKKMILYLHKELSC